MLQLYCLAQAEEFSTVRLKVTERALYKELNKAKGIRFPISGDLSLTAHKVSLILQAELGGVEFPLGDQYQKHRQQYFQDKGVIFQHTSRLIHCMVDCEIQKADSISTRSGLELVRSIAARVWDGSPAQLKQIEQIGAVAMRKLVAAGIETVDALLSTEPRRIEMILSRHPPFGSKILAKAKELPRLKLAVKVVGKVRE
jgi:ATP-dependent DNA helicase HFM1/MER3